MWVPLRRADQERLEVSEAAVAETLAAGLPYPIANVVIDGGRSEVQLRERLLYDRYSASPPRPPREVRRSFWLCSTNNGPWEPYSRKADEAIEDAYTKLLKNARSAASLSAARLPMRAQLSQAAQLPSGLGVVNLKLQLKSDPRTAFNHVEWALTTEVWPAANSWLESAQKSLAGIANNVRGIRTTVRRGSGEAPLREGEAEEEALGATNGGDGRVFILVHGSGDVTSNVGDAAGSDEGDGVGKAVRDFRSRLHHCQLVGAGYVQRPSGQELVWLPPRRRKLPSIPKDEVLEASWWPSLRNESLEDILEPLTLPTVPLLRKVANRAVGDAFLHVQPGPHEVALRAVTESVEAILARFKQHHPEFDGEVILVGNSMGGCLLFELLRAGRFSFTPGALFALGSPIAAFLRYSGNARLSASLALPGGTRFFNVYHPLDPFAYRVEPLLVPGSSLPPEQVPRESSRRGARSLLRRSSFSDRPDDGQPGAERAVNVCERIDWALQYDEAATDATVESANTFLGNASYFALPDVAAFVEAMATAAGAIDRDSSSSKEFAEVAAALTGVRLSVATSRGASADQLAGVAAALTGGQPPVGSFCASSAASSWSGEVMSGIGGSAPNGFLPATASTMADFAAAAHTVSSAVRAIGAMARAVADASDNSLPPLSPEPTQSGSPTATARASLGAPRPPLSPERTGSGVPTAMARTSFTTENSAQLPIAVARASFASADAAPLPTAVARALPAAADRAPPPTAVAKGSPSMAEDMALLPPPRQPLDPVDAEDESMWE